ncbi:ubiquitin carboxyl-terminal hydrolase 29-like [Tenrec ecaudatus]|uniref:ubiquitin carboxyl-terminal hydrolase 29-like n=1 Tax=Tenrec ecaudatus TaxID=94439 RepID=UPI003F5A9DAB
MVEGEEESRLVIVFDSNSCVGVFELSDITITVHRYSRAGRINLRLSFQNDFSVHLEELSCRDAGKLKMFLDKHCQKAAKTTASPDHDCGVLSRETTQEKSNPVPWHNARGKPRPESFSQPDPTSGASVLEEMPPFPSKAPRPGEKRPLENPCDELKEMATSNLEVGEDFVREDGSDRHKKLEGDDLTCMPSNRKKLCTLENRVDNMTSEHRPSFDTTSAGSPHPHDNVHDTQRVSAQSPLVFMSEPSGAQNEPPWNESQLPHATPPEQSGKGFPNMGNTCYMNAILQSLFAVPSFAGDLIHQGIPWEMFPAGTLILCLRQLLVFKDVCDVETKKELLTNIKGALSLVSDIYSSNTQNDAQEFLGHCLSQLTEDMEKLKSTGQGVRETAGAHSEPQVLAAQAAPRDCACPVRANFEVELQHSIFCKACGEVVCKTELSNYLSISLPQDQHPGAGSLQDSLDFFFRAEELEYKCGKCEHDLSVAIQNVSRLPRVLIVHLKRYVLDACHLLVKDNQSVSIPKYLILSSYCNEDCTGPLPLDSQAPSGKTQNLKVSQDRSSGALSSQDGLETDTKMESSKGSERAAGQLQPSDRMSGYEDIEQAFPQRHGDLEACHQPGPQSLTESDAFKHPEDKPMSSTGFHLQEDSPTSSRTLASGETPGNKDNLETAMPQVEAKGNGAVGQPLHAYRLISAVSHLGSCTQSGHYVSDLYDFTKQAWFTYDDLRVSQLQEAGVQEDRREDGYIFFYMHNDIFDMLVTKAGNSLTLNTE